MSDDTCSQMAIAANHIQAANSVLRDAAQQMRKQGDTFMQGKCQAYITVLAEIRADLMIQSGQ